MEKIEIIGGPEVEEREIPDEEKFFEVIWELNETPEEAWDKKFESLLKKHLEKENNLFGPYKPKIIYTQLILTSSSKEHIPKQKKFFQEEFIDRVNKELIK